MLSMTHKAHALEWLWLHSKHVSFISVQFKHERHTLAVCLSYPAEQLLQAIFRSDGIAVKQQRHTSQQCHASAVYM